MNSTGSALVYSTYLSGNQMDAWPRDRQYSGENAYVTVWTVSADFPTQGSIQALASGDALVTKLEPTGTVLLYSTLLSGNDEDAGTDIEVDSSGNAYDRRNPTPIRISIPFHRY